MSEQPTPPKTNTFAVYQRESRKTWSVIHTDHSIVYPTLGLTNEAGEVAGKIKKIFRDRNGEINEADREALKQELGDVLWYLTQICTELNLTSPWKKSPRPTLPNSSLAKHAM